MRVKFAGESHPGRARSNNEDVVGWDAERRVWLVADGMGGHASGEVASAIVRDTLLADGGEEALDARVCSAHQAILSTAETDEALSGMGSTVVALHADGARGQVVWVGDSRAYLWRKGRLSRITRDHSFVELLRERDDISETQLRNHPNRNVVTQTLGLGDPEPSLTELALKDGDKVLLCSDGLNDELKDDEIAAVLDQHQSPDDAAHALVERALEHGGRDNVSVVIVAFDRSDESTLLRLMNGVRRWLASGK